jgi:hypothetical protein
LEAAVATYKAKARKKYATVKTKGRARFPIGDKAHARAALARLGQAKGLSASQKRTIVSKAYKKLGTPPSKRRVKVSSSGRITKRKK